MSYYAFLKMAYTNIRTHRHTHTHIRFFPFFLMWRVLRIVRTWTKSTKTYMNSCAHDINKASRSHTLCSAQYNIRSVVAIERILYHHTDQAMERKKLPKVDRRRKPRAMCVLCSTKKESRREICCKQMDKRNGKKVEKRSVQKLKASSDGATALAFFVSPGRSFMISHTPPSIWKLLFSYPLPRIFFLFYPFS